jgi:hypothetical protein
MRTLTLYNLDGSVNTGFDLSGDHSSMIRLGGVFQLIKKDDEKVHTNLPFHIHERLTDYPHWIREDEKGSYYDVTLLSQTGSEIMKWRAVGHSYVTIYDSVISFLTREAEGEYTVHTIAGSFYVEGIKDRFNK